MSCRSSVAINPMALFFMAVASVALVVILGAEPHVTAASPIDEVKTTLKPTGFGARRSVSLFWVRLLVPCDSCPKC